MTWVVFDYGEVICTRTKALPDLANRLGVSLADFESAYWGNRDAYDRGVSDATYWKTVANAVGTDIDADLVEELTRVDIEGWAQLDPDSAALLDELARNGTRLALLSNAPASFARFAEQQPWARHFHTRVFSADVGCAKPDAKIYELLVSRLNAQPQDCVFFDDRAVNIEGAHAVGLRAHLWQGAEHARRVLAEP
ncbi:HAD family phosphatase [Saccharomonospora sp.]|uniref:HAD family hydrolase n=1 Tax=Saccharomonospora sp. TaxID=33913 RepID=UPI00260BA471|nr:HAD family phosphatase [Saccharomonospora sp.]